MTGRTMKDLEKGIDKKTAVNDIINFLKQDEAPSPEHRIIVCHNVGFDKRFLFALFS